MIVHDPDQPPPMGLAACPKCEKPNNARASFWTYCGNSMEIAARLSPTGATTRTQAQARNAAAVRPEPVKTQPVSRPARPEPLRPARVPDAAVGANDSGTRTAQTPAALRGFNWGALLLGPIWGLGNAALPAIAIGIAGGVVSYVTRSNNIWLSLTVTVAANVYIGLRANEWAWKARRWQSVEQFKRVQMGWLLWGIVLVIVLSIALAYMSSGTQT